MKVAFLFEKKNPAYDLIFRVIQAVPNQDRTQLDTLISAGFWDLPECCAGLEPRRPDQMVHFLATLFHNQEGSFTRIVSDESMVESVCGDTYAVILHSIRRSLVLRVHESLRSTGEYRGLIEVLPHSAIHRQVFGFCPPIIRAENKHLFVLSTTEEGQDDDEGSQLADEIVSWAKEEWRPLGFKVVKKHVGLKGSIFDRDSEKTFETQMVVRRIGDHWMEIAEHVIYKLSDFAPDVVAELTSALRVLEKPQMTEADCGQVSTSLRRSLELLAELLATGNPEGLAEARLNRPIRGDNYKNLIWNYLCEQFRHNEFLRDELWKEFGLLGRLLDKGVHEHWITEMIRPLAVRTILVMNSLLFPIKAGVVQLRMGDDLFT